MKINMHGTLKFVAILTIGSPAWSVWAGGSRLPDQDAFATGRGEAFVATADNPSAIFYNPAGISQLTGNNLRAGIYGIYLDPSYKSPANGQTYDNQFKYHAIPQFFYTYGKTNWPVSFGFGSYSPFGLGVIWPQKYSSGIQQRGHGRKLSTETINPVIAIKLSPTLSIGGGVMVNYTKINVQNSMLQFNGDGWDVGYNLGLLWQPQEKISFGATFRSPTTVNFNGHTGITGLGTSSANAQWPFPLEAVFGVSYRPTPKWNLEFDADYTDWSTLGTVNFNQTSPPLSGIAPTIPNRVGLGVELVFRMGRNALFQQRLARQRRLHFQRKFLAGCSLHASGGGYGQAFLKRWPRTERQKF